jgi:hypothetical protein
MPGGQKLSAALASKIIEELERRNVSGVCPICRTGQFGVVDGFTAPLLYKNQAETTLFAERVVLPCATCSCKRCGFVAQFSLAMLGLDEIFWEETANG